MSEEIFDLELSSLPGTLTTNITQLKAFIERAAEPYLGALVTEDQIAFAKRDLAKLRKLKESLESERKRAKAVILKPYEDFELLYKDAVKSLDEAIRGIDVQVKDFQQRQKDERKEAVDKAVEEAAEGLEEGLSGMLTARVRAWLDSPSWLLQGTRWGKAEDEIRAAVGKFYDDLTVIRGMDDEFSPLRLDVFLSTGNIRMAQDRVEELRRQGETRKAKAVRAEAKTTEDENAEAPEGGAGMITIPVPAEPDDPALLETVRIPAVLEMERYKKKAFRTAMTALGVKIRPQG